MATCNPCFDNRAAVNHSIGLIRTAGVRLSLSKPADKGQHIEALRRLTYRWAQLETKRRNHVARDGFEKQLVWSDLLIEQIEYDPLNATEALWLFKGDGRNWGQVSAQATGQKQ